MNNEIQKPRRVKGAVLPTSRHATGRPERSVFAILRDLMPRRALTLGEADQLAELQATHLLRLAGLTGPPTPAALIAELPRLQVVTDPDLPTSASALWVSGRWLVLLNGSEPTVRNRFSLAHELKHCLDHRHRHLTYTSQLGLNADTVAEHAADTFAAALLMPKLWVRQQWTSGRQRLSDLAEMFDVSPEAMATRLNTLGLIDLPRKRHQRDNRPPQRNARRTDLGAAT